METKLPPKPKRLTVRELCDKWAIPFTGPAKRDAVLAIANKEADDGLIEHKVGSLQTVLELIAREWIEPANKITCTCGGVKWKLTKKGKLAAVCIHNIEEEITYQKANGHGVIQPS